MSTAGPVGIHDVTHLACFLRWIIIYERSVKTLTCCDVSALYLRRITRSTPDEKQKSMCCCFFVPAFPMTLPEIFLTPFCGDEGERSCLVPGGGRRWRMGSKLLSEYFRFHVIPLGLRGTGVSNSAGSHWWNLFKQLKASDRPQRKEVGLRLARDPAVYNICPQHSSLSHHRSVDVSPGSCIWEISSSTLFLSDHFSFIHLVVFTLCNTVMEVIFICSTRSIKNETSLWVGVTSFNLLASVSTGLERGIFLW